MAFWRLTYRVGGTVDVEADECRRAGAHVVLYRYTVVVCEPRAVVVLRVLARDVERVESAQT